MAAPNCRACGVHGYLELIPVPGTPLIAPKLSGRHWSNFQRTLTKSNLVGRSTKRDGPRSALSCSVLATMQNRCADRQKFTALVWREARWGAAVLEDGARGICLSRKSGKKKKAPISGPFDRLLQPEADCWVHSGGMRVFGTNLCGPLHHHWLGRLNYSRSLSHTYRTSGRCRFGPW